jgi:hypothetical protein
MTPSFSNDTTSQPLHYSSNDDVITQCHSTIQHPITTQMSYHKPQANNNSISSMTTATQNTTAQHNNKHITQHQSNCTKHGMSTLRRASLDGQLQRAQK